MNIFKKIITTNGFNPFLDRLRRPAAFLLTMIGINFCGLNPPVVGIYSTAFCQRARLFRNLDNKDEKKNRIQPTNNKRLNKPESGSNPTRNRIKLFPRLNPSKPRPRSKSNINPYIQPKSNTSPKKLTSKPHQPSIVESTLSTCHDVRKKIESKKWQNIVDTFNNTGSSILHYGSAIFTPVQFLYGKAKNYLYDSIFSISVKLLQAADSYLNPGPKTKSDAKEAEENTLETAKNFTDIVHYATNNFEFVEKMVDLFSDSLVKGLLSPESNQAIENRVKTTHDQYTKQLKKGEKLSKEAYKAINDVRKDEIAKQIFARFEDSLPSALQNGNAYLLYKGGSYVYEFASSAYKNVRFIYKLVDNVTSVLSLSYQLTTHAEAIGETMCPTKIEKTMAVIDITRRCADTYLEVVQYFDLNDNNNTRYTFFQRVLWLYVKAAGFLIPFSKNVATVKRNPFPAMPVLNPSMAGINPQQID